MKWSEARIQLIREHQTLLNSTAILETVPVYGQSETTVEVKEEYLHRRAYINHLMGLQGNEDYLNQALESLQLKRYVE